ncbi:hypothetical protein ACFQYP_64525 [Nonomuraea antimicrobica]
MTDAAQEAQYPVDHVLGDAQERGDVLETGESALGDGEADVPVEQVEWAAFLDGGGEFRGVQGKASAWMRSGRMPGRSAACSRARVWRIVSVEVLLMGSP